MDWVDNYVNNKKLYGWINDATTKKNWTLFLDKYKDYFKDYDGYIRIPRRRFSELNNLIDFIYAADAKGNEIKSVHKTFVFSLYVLLNTVSRKNGLYLSIEETKEILGFNKESNSIDYLIKGGGLLDKYNTTRTYIKGISGRINSNTKKIKYKTLMKQWREKDYDFKSGSFVILNMPIFLYMLYYVKEISVKGIYIYCYLLTKCIPKNNMYIFTSISLDKIVREVGLNKTTIEKYISILENHGLIEVERGKYLEDEFGDIMKADGTIVGKEINKYRVLTDLQNLKKDAD